MDKDSSAKPKKEKKKRGRRIKETFSELKKVTWPSFATVVKQTSVVLGVVLMFSIVLFGFDMLLRWLYTLLVDGLNSGVETASVLSAAKHIGEAWLPLWQ